MGDARRDEENERARSDDENRGQVHHRADRYVRGRIDAEGGSGIRQGSSQCNRRAEIRQQSRSVEKVWSVRGSNSRPFGCKPNALPAELTPRAKKDRRPVGVTGGARGGWDRE